MRQNTPAIRRRRDDSAAGLRGRSMRGSGYVRTLGVVLFSIYLCSGGVSLTVRAREPDRTRALDAGAVSSIQNRDAFDRLARTQPAGSGTQMPLVLFVVDRAQANSVTFVNSRQYRFHKDFLNATYQTLERTD